MWKLDNYCLYNGKRSTKLQISTEKMESFEKFCDEADPEKKVIERIKRT